MKYLLNAEEIIAFGKEYFKRNENGREFTDLDEKFVTIVAKLINAAYEQGKREGAL